MDLIRVGRAAIDLSQVSGIAFRGDQVHVYTRSATTMVFDRDDRESFETLVARLPDFDLWFALGADYAQTGDDSPVGPEDTAAPGAK